ncbi:MAG: hypothetical protein FJ194_00740 [Gammaproteobacteria bacterium]|nr:hypothetical protein [Gammaproteobacteria bacterium]
MRRVPSVGSVVRRSSSSLLRSAVCGCLALVGLTAQVQASAPLDNFVLIDQHGTAQELYYQSDARALIIVAHDSTCSSSAADLARIGELRKRFGGDLARFMLLNSDSATNRAKLRESAAANGVDLPVLHDDSQLVSRTLGLKSTGDTLVINPSNWSVSWQGNLNAAHEGIGALAKADASVSLSAAGKSAPCAIRYDEVPAGITYTADAAQILRDNCAVCHTTGGIAPWAMTGYEMVRGFAPMIREVLRTRRMPPWNADPEVGRFEHDKSLSREELRTLVSWIEQGAVRGEGEDILASDPVAWQDWPLGKPDLIMEIPSYDVPATGIVDYQFPRIPNPLKESVWVRAATVVPGDRSAVHHVLMGASEPGVPIVEGRENVFDNYIIGYAPGNESAEMPTGTGVYVQPGTEFLFQMHYTPYGKATTDRTKVGLYFHKEAPRNFLRHTVVINPTIQIPPNEAASAQAAYFEFDKPAVIYSLVPHAHYRGKASKFELLLPGGRRETVLNVPQYDFNWQRTYAFEEPLKVPAGARLVHTTIYDNSVKNARNPDPERTVPWGLQSHDEMLYGAVSFAWAGETADKPIHEKGLADTYQWVGFLDKNMDGKLSWQELPERMKKRLVQGFKMVDANGDGGLDAREMYALNKRQNAQRTPEQPRQGSPAAR